MFFCFPHFAFVNGTSVKLPSPSFIFLLTYLYPAELIDVNKLYSMDYNLILSIFIFLF